MGSGYGIWDNMVRILGKGGSMFYVLSELSVDGLFLSLSHFGS